MILLISAALILIDQLSKAWVVRTFPQDGLGQYIGLGFYFTYVRNTGAAFGILQNVTLILGTLSAIVSIIIIIYLLRSQKQGITWQRFALSLILAGALGNMIDRFRLGYVVDFIHFMLPNFNFPVFNIADSCVVVGAFLLIISSLFGNESQPTATADLEEAYDTETKHIENT